MKTLRSYVNGRWHESATDARPLYNPSTEEQIAQASSSGVDFGAALDFARTRGGAALAELTFAQRGELLKAMSRAMHGQRDELIRLSIENTGTTRRDAKFDLDGATGTLHYYATLGAGLGERTLLADGEGDRLGRSARFWGQHVRVPRRGAAVLINAFNFPAWGFGEKAAAAILAGMPVICKPATSTALVTERCIEILVDAGVLPEGVVSLIVGSTGDLLERLGPQDVLSFTGSADTALKLRRMENLLRDSVAVNIEADSLNAAVLGPDVDGGSETWNLFLRDVVREMTQKTGQKCTAVRRIFVPREAADELQGELAERLGEVVTGDPQDASVTMGPLTTPDQLQDDLDGVQRLGEAARIVHGSGERIDGVGAAPGRGYFFGPTLLRADDAGGADVVHEHEVFGPVATLLPFDGAAAEAAELVGLARGTLVTSLYSDDDAWVGAYLAAGGGAHTGRLYLGSEKMAEQAPGSGVALPQSLHGGPGRAGGGEELGGLRALDLYTQRVALQGSRKMLQGLIGDGGEGD
jgi:oxepin-CoA hydrolase/3-oxo-5,6-dehydrosuberyl-CoA semialdehyde dehydrogenase